QHSPGLGEGFLLVDGGRCPAGSVLEDLLMPQRFFTAGDEFLAFAHIGMPIDALLGFQPAQYAGCIRFGVAQRRVGDFNEPPERSLERLECLDVVDARFRHGGGCWFVVASCWSPEACTSNQQPKTSNP